MNSAVVTLARLAADIGRQPGARDCGSFGSNSCRASRLANHLFHHPDKNGPTHRPNGNVWARSWRTESEPPAIPLVPIFYCIETALGSFFQPYFWVNSSGVSVSWPWSVKAI